MWFKRRGKNKPDEDFVMEYIKALASHAESCRVRGIAVNIPIKISKGEYGKVGKMGAMGEYGNLGLTFREKKDMEDRELVESIKEWQRKAIREFAIKLLGYSFNLASGDNGGRYVSMDDVVKVAKEADVIV